MTTKLLRFDQFMQHALHHPEHGYYARKIRTVGALGDFSTTATLSPTLGAAIAQRAADWLRRHPGSFELIEIGAGDGSLAASILSALPFMLRLKVRYHIVDTSAPLRQVQAERLKKFKIKWHDDVQSALHHCHGRAYIFSNELVDAFPVRIFQRSQDAWQELHLENGKETFLPAHELPDSSALCPDHPENHRIEIHQAYQHWLEDWIASWREGEMITIDYGDTYPEIYHRRPQGTIRAFLMHENITGPAIYQNVGHQDLTADVNFTDLINWGHDYGLETIYYATQTDFLTPYAKNTTQDLYLLHPDGPGSAFKVLIQTPT